MAFTPQGMFYLSQKDLQPSMDTIGTGFRGMLGLQNKEGAVNEILQGADYDTPEGRRIALNQIRAIDPAAWEKYNKMNEEFEIQSLNKRVAAKTLDIKDLEYNRKTNEPLVTQRWELEGKDNFARTYVVEKLRNIMSEEDLKAFLPTVKASNVTTKVGLMLNKLKDSGDLSEEDFKLYKPTDFKGLLKSARENYISQWQDKDINADLFKETDDNTDTTSKNIVLPGGDGVGNDSNSQPFFRWDNPNKGKAPAKDLPTDSFLGGA